MITLEDARGRTLTLREPPRRIISLVPSQTELLSSLGLDEEVVGITRFCVHPPTWRSAKRIVGGTKLIREDRIRELRPDLVFANLEENTRQDVEMIEEIAPVFVTNVRTLEEAADMIESVGLLVDRAGAGAEVAAAIRTAFDLLVDELGLHEQERRTTASTGAARSPRRDSGRRGEARTSRSGTGRTPHDAAAVRAAYLIWRDPFMSVGGDTFIHDMLSRGGFENVFGASIRYPTVSARDLIDARPDVVFLSSEPFPFDDAHRSEIEDMLPQARVRLVDGQLFSWYGSRLIHTPDYLRQLRAELGLSA